MSKYLPFLIILLFIPAFFVEFDPDRITSGIFRSYRLIKENEKIEVRNGKTATISLHEGESNFYIKTNGKADASLMKDRSKPIAGDELTQAATAFMPMATRNAPYTAAMVGLGSAMGSHYLLADPLLERLDCIEIEEEMVKLARKGFYPHNYRSFDDPRMNLHIGDARTYFHTAGREYDLIVSVPSNPWVSGVASLFSLEFYHHIKRYLKPGGQLVQWLQLYEFDNELLLHIVRALDESFQNIAVYRSPEEPDVIIIASDSPVEQKYIDRFHIDSTLKAEFERIHRPWYFFGEQNFLFKASSIRPLLKMAEANSEYTPVVDNKAERARFVNTYVGLIDAFDSCQVCWSEFLDSADYAPRRAFRDSLEITLPRNYYLENHLLLSLKGEASPSPSIPPLAIPASASAINYSSENRNEQLAEFTATPSMLPLSSVNSPNANGEAIQNFDWERFWKDYKIWNISAPFSPARDSIPLYAALKSIVNKSLIITLDETADSATTEKFLEQNSFANSIPLAITLEFTLMDLAMHRRYKEAADLIPIIDDNFNLKDADEVFLRNLFLVGMLGGERDYIRKLFLKVYLPDAYLDKAEKYLMKTVAGVPDRIRKTVLQERAVKEN